MKQLSIGVVAFLTLLLSCNHKQSLKKNKHGSDTVEISQDNAKMHLIADSLRTPEQAEILLKLTKLVSKNTVVVDNQMVLLIGEDAFVKEGIPKSYYKKVIEEFKINNRYIDSLKLDANQIISNSKFFKNQ